MNDDHARPIPQGRRPGRPADEDVYVVDTRRASHPAPTSTAKPRRAATAPKPGHTAYDELGRPVSPGRPTPPTPPRGPRTPRSTRPPRSGRARRLSRLVLAAVAAWVVFIVVTPIHAWSQVAREDTTPTTQRPADASGSTYLLVGSDSREGLTAAERKAIGVGGDAEGRRTDSIILVHTPSGSGKPVLISIPRDSFLPIPGHKDNKEIGRAHV